MPNHTLRFTCRHGMSQRPGNNALPHAEENTKAQTQRHDQQRNGRKRDDDAARLQHVKEPELFVHGANAL